MWLQPLGKPYRYDMDYSIKGGLGRKGGPSRYIREVTDPPFDSATGEIFFSSPKLAPEAIKEARSLRYRLQDAAREILYLFHGNVVPKDHNGFDKHHRTCRCTRKRVASTVQIIRSNQFQKSFFSGVETCANSRTCAVCGSRINEFKANELRLLCNQSLAIDCHVSLLTFTAPHKATDTIEFLVPAIKASLASFWEGSPAKRFKNRYGIEGHVFSFEVLYGVNGWHPHFHIIIISKNPLPVTNRDCNGNVLPMQYQDEQWQWILKRWQTVTQKYGLDCPNEYGLDIQNGDAAGEYISKFGSDGQILETKNGKTITWDMADEMTKGNTKKGRKGSLTPWDLLELSLSGSDDEKHKAKMLFLFYARTMKGVTMIKWSRGLRDKFGLKKELSDEEILHTDEDSADLLCHVMPTEWVKVIKSGQRDILLQLAENGGSESVARFLYKYSDFQTFEEYYSSFLSR